MTDKRARLALSSISTLCLATGRHSPAGGGSERVPAIPRVARCGWDSLVPESPARPNRWMSCSARIYRYARERLLGLRQLPGPPRRTVPSVVLTRRRCRRSPSLGCRSPSPPAPAAAGSLHSTSARQAPTATVNQEEPSEIAAVGESRRYASNLSICPSSWSLPW